MTDLFESKRSLDIENIDHRDRLKSFTFPCKTKEGTVFGTTMQGYSQKHAYRRLKAITAGEITIAYEAI